MPTASSRAPSDSTRLYLDDVPMPVVARVARRTPEALTLSQDLPFLRLRKGVRDAEGREAELASVYLAVHGDTPRLMLELRYKESEPPPSLEGSPLRASRADGAAPYRPLGESERPPRRDETTPYVVERTSSPPAPRVSALPGARAAGDEDATQVVRALDAERDTVPSSRPAPGAALTARGAWAVWARDALLSTLRAALGWLERYLA